MRYIMVEQLFQDYINSPLAPRKLLVEGGTLFPCLFSSIHCVLVGSAGRTLVGGLVSMETSPCLRYGWRWSCGNLETITSILVGWSIWAILIFTRSCCQILSYLSAWPSDHLSRLATLNLVLYKETAIDRSWVVVLIFLDPSCPNKSGYHSINVYDLLKLGGQ